MLCGGTSISEGTLWNNIQNKKTHIGSISFPYLKNARKYLLMCDECGGEREGTNFASYALSIMCCLG